MEEAKGVLAEEESTVQGFFIEVPNKVGARVYVFHNNKAKHLLIERIDITCTKEGPEIKYKLEDLKKLVTEDKIYQTYEQLGRALVEKFSD